MRIVRVKGDSMQPCYRDGDYLLITRYRRRRPRPGDDVVFEHPDFGTLLKRIDSIESGRLQLRGLNPLSADAAALGTVDIAVCSGLRRVAWQFSRR